MEGKKEPAGRKEAEPRESRRGFLRLLTGAVVGAGALLSGFPNFKRFSNSWQESGAPLEAINNLALPEEAQASECYAQYAGFCAAVCEGGNCQVSSCQGSGNCQGAGPCQGAGNCQNSVCQGTNCQSGDCQGATCQGAGNIYIICNGQIQACQCQGNHGSCGVHINKVLEALREKNLLKPAPRQLTRATFGLTPPKSAAQMKPAIQRMIKDLENQGLIEKQRGGSG